MICIYIYGSSHWNGSKVLEGLIIMILSMRDEWENKEILQTLTNVMVCLKVKLEYNFKSIIVKTVYFTH